MNPKIKKVIDECKKWDTICGECEYRKNDSIRGFGPCLLRIMAKIDKLPLSWSEDFVKRIY